MKLLAVDPGTHDLGVARFDDGVLAAATVIQAKTLEDMAGFVRAGVLAELLACDEVVVERPEIYPRSKGDPNDLIAVALVAGAWSLAARRRSFVLPKIWKRQLPKDICVRRIEKLLSIEELRIANALHAMPKTVGHNGWDAVGIGLWKLGRFVP